MKIDDCLLPALVQSQAALNSAKGIFTQMARLMAEHIPGADASSILDALLARERLGTTALSHGAALPHAVCPGLDQPMACLIQLQNPIDFAAADKQPVDLFFGLLLPEHSEEHLPLLADIASRLRVPAYRDALRQANTAQSLYAAALQQP